MTGNNGSSDKDHLRRKFRKLRRQHLCSPDFAPEAFKAQVTKFMAHILPAPSGTAAIYQSWNYEADPSLCVSTFPRWKWAYPKVEAHQLRFFVPTSGESMLPNQWNILEPDPQKSEEVSLRDLSMIIVPGLAFDRMGSRLGSGYGFYDRALEKFQGLKVGLAYSVQVSNEFLPREPHDVLMDFVLTEKYILESREQRVTAAEL